MGDFTYENNLVPKFPSQVIRNAEIIEGNGGPRTIKKTIYAEEECNYSVVGGDPNNDTVRNVSYNSKIVTTLDGGYSSSTSSYRSYSSTSTGKRQVNAEGTGRIKAIKNHPHPHAYN
ncbi:major allergen Mal d 1-like [Quercus lobata]|uniref:major allergen Mal d 1-like n=1 Tax=Quercus lobata TaxID=97700 RepID=UPI0012478442|nr:major allergen Mal d 1-like [Quercus lobata]